MQTHDARMNSGAEGTGEHVHRRGWLVAVTAALAAAFQRFTQPGRAQAANGEPLILGQTNTAQQRRASRRALAERQVP